MTTLDRIRSVSPWWILAVYVVLAWLLVQIVQALSGALDLPSWVLTVAWVLLVIGLPVVGVTSFLQHGRVAGEVPVRRGAAEDDDTIRSVFTWSNTLVGGIGGFMALSVSAGAWILTGPEASLAEVAAEGGNTPVVASAGSATEGASDAFRGLASAIQALDVEATLAFYDEEPGFTHVFQTQLVEGRDAFDARVRDSFEGLREIPVWDIEALRATQLDPNTVLVVARFHEVTVDTAGVRQAYEGVFTNVFVRRSDGWRVSHGHVAADEVADSTR